MKRAVSQLSSEQISTVIANYERRHLESISPQVIDPVELLRQHSLIQVTGIGNFWDGKRVASFSRHVADFVSGTHGYGGYLTFLLTGGCDDVEMFMAIQSEETAAALLTSAFPGIEINNRLDSSLADRIAHRSVLMGMLSGIPSRKNGFGEKGLNQQAQPGEEFFHLERLVRGMRSCKKGTGWVYLVQAYALKRSNALNQREELLSLIAQVGSLTKGQYQHSEQKNQSRTEHTSQAVSESLGLELINKQAEYTVELLEQQLKRVDEALAVGCWQVAVYYGATTSEDLARVSALLTGVLSGPDSRPDPFRSSFCTPNGVPAHRFHTELTSEELSLLVRPLREESPGFRISDLAEFDTAPMPMSAKALKIGNVLIEGKKSDSCYSIRLEDLTRHGAVFGVTGSGKTTTVLGWMYELAKQRPPVPFLVIEPAKTEYRALLGKIVNGSPTGPIPNLQVYTLGSDTTAPFRMNPFEFDLGDNPGQASVLSHIDFLKAVFNSAFILYAPMPYVLETALYEIYQDCGWNLATETNVRLPERDWARRDEFPIFPTLTNLYDKVEEVTARLGYESRIEQDVVAGLKARLGAMRLGAKGLMLDTPRGISMKSLLSAPVVLEMEAIGNDDEKTFLIGLLFARLYGYRRLQAAKGELSSGLQHVMVIEEAHRLLKNVNTQVETESSNMRAAAIETFVNMLSEVRHYGQGVLVAEQIPGKLTPDVIKNTNLKVIHRLMAQDDRELVGGSMNMDEGQVRRLSTLKEGEAAVFTKDDDHPLLVKVDNSKTKLSLNIPNSASLPSYVERYMILGPYLPAPDFAAYGIHKSSFGGPDLIVYQAALQHIGRVESSRVWARLLARLIYMRSNLSGEIERLRSQIALDPCQLQPAQLSEGLLMLLVLGAARLLNERGREAGWMFVQAENMRKALTSGLTRMARTKDIAGSAGDLDRFARSYTDSHKREFGPYPGCVMCSSRCVYRSEVSRLITHVDYNEVQQVFSKQEYATLRERYDHLRQCLVDIARNWLGGESSFLVEIGYCAALHIAPSIGLDLYEQTEMAQRLAGWML